MACPLECEPRRAGPLPSPLKPPSCRSSPPRPLARCSGPTTAQGSSLSRPRKQRYLTAMTDAETSADLATALPDRHSAIRRGAERRERHADCMMTCGRSAGASRLAFAFSRSGACCHVATRRWVESDVFVAIRRTQPSNPRLRPTGLRILYMRQNVSIVRSSAVARLRTMRTIHRKTAACSRRNRSEGLAIAGCEPAPAGPCAFCITFRPGQRSYAGFRRKTRKDHTAQSAIADGNLSP